MLRTLSLYALTFALPLLASWAGAGDAHAQAPAPVAKVQAQEKMATVAVDIVRASKTPGKTDPRLEKFRRQLADFSFQRYRLLDSRLVTVEEKQTVSVPLEKGRKLQGKDLQVTYVKQEKDGRARLKLVIPGVVDTTVTLALDGTVILGGPAIPSGENGVLFLPVTLVTVK
jgi:hypothetical protein